MAATALGAQVLALPMEASSTTKGESLVDTLLTLERTGIETIVLRHGASGAPYLAARATGMRIVNAGDGTHAHPTQALLDALTLHDALGGLEGAVIAIVGDIGHSRVARSNLHLLARLGATVRLAGPPAWTRGFDAYPDVEVHRELADALAGADAVMALRVQLERDAGGGVPSAARVHRAAGAWTRSAWRLARPGAPVLHPGPTNEGVELTAALASSSRSLIGRAGEQRRGGAHGRAGAARRVSPLRLARRPHRPASCWPASRVVDPRVRHRCGPRPGSPWTDAWHPTGAACRLGAAR